MRASAIPGEEAPQEQTRAMIARDGEPTTDRILAARAGHEGGHRKWPSDRRTLAHGIGRDRGHAFPSCRHFPTRECSGLFRAGAALQSGLASFARHRVVNGEAAVAPAQSDAEEKVKWPAADGRVHPVCIRHPLRPANLRGDERSSADPANEPEAPASNLMMRAYGSRRQRD